MAQPKAKPKAAAAIPGCVIYLRVSTGAQAASGLGLEAQEAKCRALAAERGWNVLAVRQDAGLSGRDGLAKRPGLRAVIDDAKANPGAVVVVASLSRLGRSQRLIWTLLDTAGEYALPVVSATEPFDTASPMGRAMIGMIGVWAQLEADLVSERTTDALAAAKDRGTKLGAPSMIESTDEEGRRFIDAAKAALVRRVQELYATGAYSHRTLAEHLNASGVASATGKQWHARTVRVALNTEVPA
jgi:site-specific DNA recombinase